jgi:hypothetical protein
VDKTQSFEKRASMTALFIVQRSPDLLFFMTDWIMLWGMRYLRGERD